MGQTTMGIMWGVRVPEGVALVTDESDGLFDVWAQGDARSLIDAHDAKVRAWAAAKPGRYPWRRMDGRDRYVPQEEWDAGVCGFFVAVGASGREGIPSLGGWKSLGYTPVEMTRAGVKLAFPKAYRNAVARYARFRRWCAENRGFVAGAEHFATTKPTLWLVPTEVA